MRKRFQILFCMAMAGFIFIAHPSAPLYAEHGWPIDPMNGDHPIGNTMGEFQQYAGGVYQHDGIDILETPNSPMVRVTVSGTVTQLGDADWRYNGTIIEGVDGVDYWYWHLAHNSYDVNYVNNFNNGTYVAAADPVAQVVTWHIGNFHHLHYLLERGAEYLNPMASIAPNNDTEFPDILSINFAQDNSNPWNQFNPLAPNACTVVNGPVDIIAQIHDQDSAGSTLGAAQLTNWVYNVRWRACPDNNADCPWIGTHTFGVMPTNWGNRGNAQTAAQFSNRAPWDSESEYWTNTQLYGIVTNFVGGVPNVNGNWNTTAIADGSYSVSIEATDFASNSTVYGVRACVQNGANCIRELMIRDGIDDTGAIPYPGADWGASPDITVNDGTTDRDVKITIGRANAIQVRVWNYGNCNLPAGHNYTVCIGWGEPTSEAVPHPLPAAQQIACQPQAVPAGGWAVGSSQLTNFNWAPATGTIPEGDYCIVAWVDEAQDPVLDTFSVSWDDNRAQENVVFGQPAPVCTNGDTRQVSCTSGGRQGVRTDRCVNGTWDQGACRVPTCIDGDERWTTCNRNGALGWQRYICRNGDWRTSGGCIANIP